MKSDVSLKGAITGF